MRAFWILAGFLAGGAQALADQLDLSFNADAVRVGYARPLPGNALQWDVGWLHHQDVGDLVHAGLALVGKASEGANPLTGGLGLRAVYSDGERRDQDGFAAAVGGFIRWTVPRFNRIALGGEAWFAPEVLTFSGMRKYQDFSVRASYNILREADVFVGARYVRGDYDDAPDARFDTGLHVGLALRF